MTLQRTPASRTVTFIDAPPKEDLFCPIISVDDHVLEPPSLFESRLERRFAEHAPRVEVDDAGMEWWIVDGTPVQNDICNGAVGRVMAEWDLAGARYDEFQPAAWDPRARLADMDISGVWASLCFSSVIWGFAGTRFSRTRDSALGLACLRAYNDWMLEEWCGAAPDRYIPCQLPWMADPDVAAQEIFRNAERGFRAVSFSENPEGLGFPSIYTSYWDPFLAACEETRTVVNLHVGSSGVKHKPSSDSAMAVVVALFPESGLEALIDWTFARIPLRFPRIQIVLSEAGASWVPMALERMGRAHRQRGSKLNDWPDGAPSPQEVALRNFTFASLEDPAAFRLLDLIGEDNIMIETDYPHFDSTWPHCQAMIASELTGLDRRAVSKICYGNAARLYRHPLPPDHLIAASEWMRPTATA